MKAFKRLIIFCISLICALPAFAACSVNGEKSYTESTAKIDNPDQGFYRPVYTEVKEDGVSYNKNIVGTGQLYHLRADISAFSSKANGSADKPLSKSALDGLDGLLSYLCEREKSAIIRLAYDPKYGGKKDVEPSTGVMLQHISQVCEVLNKYELTVTAIEVGMIGPWGEMHSSAAAKPEIISQLIAAYLENTENIPVLARTPKMIYDYLGVTADEAENYEISPESSAYRLGIFNDGYLGSDSDLGTYSNRERDVAFVGRQSDRLPFGGEVAVPDSTLHDIDKCTPEMFKLHLSYLNAEWNNNVIDKWKNSFYTEICGDDTAYYGKTAFEYIENRMGYRIVLSGSNITFSKGTPNIKLKFKNLGFGNFNRIYNAKIILCGEDGDKVFEGCAGRFDGSASAEYEISKEIPAGKYKAYLCIYGLEREGKPAYTVKLANEGIYNEAIRSNFIGEIKI